MVFTQNKTQKQNKRTPRWMGLLETGFSQGGAM